MNPPEIALLVTLLTQDDLLGYFFCSCFFMIMLWNIPFCTVCSDDHHAWFSIHFDFVFMQCATSIRICTFLDKLLLLYGNNNIEKENGALWRWSKRNFRRIIKAEKRKRRSEQCEHTQNGFFFWKSRNFIHFIECMFIYMNSCKPMQSAFPSMLYKEE